MCALKFFVFFIVVLVSPSSGDPVMILPANAPDWSYLHTLDELNMGFDPATIDPDYFETWFDQSIGGYQGSTNYDGPAFTGGATAPFEYGDVSGIVGGTVLVQPEYPTRRMTWFLKEIDGGAQGFSNLYLKILAHDAAFVYLNGTIIARPGLGLGYEDRWTTYAQGEGNEERFGPIFISHKPVLQPGPNLLAISVHTAPSSNDNLGLKVSLEGEPGLPDIGYSRQEALTHDSVTLRWVSKVPGNSVIRYGTSVDALTENVSVPNFDHSHILKLQGLIPETTYYYEILKPNGSSANPPVTGSLTTQITTLLVPDSGDWAYYQSIDAEGNGFDPVTLDPDFATTWFNQSLGNYQGTGNYNGPAFDTGAQAPFALGYVFGASGYPNATELRATNLDGAETAWFLKVIDGGTTGFSNLEFNLLADDGGFIYLNGKLVGTLNFPIQADDQWSLRTQENGSEHFRYITKIGEPVLLPGPNLIAVSVHEVKESERGFDGVDLGFGLTMTGSIGLPTVSRQSETVLSDTGFEVSWISAEPGNTVLRYGLEAGNLDQMVTAASNSREHQVRLSGLIPFTDYFYEILTSAGDPFDPALTGSFQTERSYLLHPNSSDWKFILPYDESRIAIDPSSIDPDFYQSWLDHDYQGYEGSAIYDGPAFAPAPRFPVYISEEGRSSFADWPETHSFLPYQESGENERLIWFIHEVDGGSFGMSDLQVELGMRGSAFVYLNGVLIATHNAWSLVPDRWPPENEWISWDPPTHDRMPLELIDTPVLQPGSNLVAIAVRIQNPGWPASLDFSMYGSAGLPETPSPAVKLISDHSASVYWVTPESGPGFLNYGLNPDHLDLTVDALDGSFSHSLPLANLRAGNVYYYEILTATRESYDPPLTGSFLTARHQLVDPGSGDWAYFQSLDVTQKASDPALADPDFHQTWFDQPFANYPGTLGYDGPAFTLGGRTPMTYGQLEWNFSPNTILPIPENRSGKVIWLLKEIDGGEFGFSELEMTVTLESAAIFYLNGERIAHVNLPEGSDDNWQPAPFNSSASGSRIPLSNEPILNPGPNLLAISLRPNADFREFSFFASISGNAGIPPIKNVTVDRIGGHHGGLTWKTRESVSSIIRFGTNRENLDRTQQLDHATTDHEVTLIELENQTNYYYRIISIEADGSEHSFEGSFNTLSGPQRGPYLQKVSHQAATICWRSFNAINSVYYGLAFDRLDLESKRSPESLDHTVVLEGLLPDTVYYYEIGGSLPTESSPPHITHSRNWFRTAPLPGTRKKTRIWAIGDSGTKDSNARRVYEAYQQYHGSPRADVWLMLGDNAYSVGSDRDYGDAVFDMYPQMLRTTPVWPTMGNHDGYSGETYYKIFDLPTHAEAGGIPSGTESFYSFDHGNIHFVCLNSEEHSDGTGGMAEWLQMDLEATTSEWIIAYFHHGPYTKGSHNSDTEPKHGEIRENFLGILEEYGVDLILSGHSHGYERSKFIDGHYGKSWTYSDQEHAVDSGNGSDIGSVVGNARFVESGGDGAYEKALVASHAGQVSIIAGASGKVTGGFPSRNPHPVMVNSMRILGSLVIDIDGLRLDARYLDDAGNVRDHFAIQKGNVLRVVSDKEAVGGAGSHFTIHREGASNQPLVVDYLLSGPALNLAGAPPNPSGSITFAAGETSKVIELITPTDGIVAGSRILTLTLSERSERVTATSVNRPSYFIAHPGSEAFSLQNSPIQRWWLASYGPVFRPDWARDDDGDGHSILIEYAYGGSPTVAESDRFFQPSFRRTSTAVELHYSRNKNLTGFRFVPAVSDDLTHFRDADLPDVITVPAGADGSEQRKVTLPIGLGKKFLSLEIRRD